MTLIIGFRCVHGMALVSDTKITTAAQRSPTSASDKDEEGRFASKISQPMLNNAFIVGAAGYTDLSREFNNKIPELADQRIIEYRNMNMKELRSLGYSVDEAIQELENSKRFTPFQYTYENLMDDCKRLIKNISDQRRQQSVNPLDMLIGVKKGSNPPSLHYVNSWGLEEEIPFWCPIGMGVPYVNQYFGNLYDFNMDMCDLIALALYCIVYAKDVAEEPSVGYSYRHPPEAYAIFNNGHCEKIRINNITELLKGIEKDARKIKNLIKNSQIENVIKTDTVMPAELNIKFPNHQG